MTKLNKIEGRKSGFTLAEILIVLVTLGIIFSSVIPQLTQKIQDAQFKVAWKGMYSIIDQASRRVLMDNGGTFKGLCGSYDTNCVRDKYKVYLNTVRLCDDGNSLGTDKCWHANNSDFKYLNGDIITGWGPEAGMVLSNGALIKFVYVSNACTDTVFSTISKCGWIMVDVNGFKGPNTIGRDILGAWIMEPYIKAQGSLGDYFDYGPDSPDCRPSGTGHGCSAKYLKE